jgi:hypothetical protein
VISTGFLVQRKNQKLDRVVSLGNKKVLVKNCFGEHEIVVQKSKLRGCKGISEFDDEVLAVRNFEDKLYSIDIQLS